MGKQMAEIMAHRADDDNGPDMFDSTELLGDLLTLLDAEPTPVESDETYKVPGPLKSKECTRDTCCVWKSIADEMAAQFRGSSGRCSRFARMAVRLGFHDTGAWSKDFAGQTGGGDGSICLTSEVTQSENNGLQDMCAKMNQWYNKWKKQFGYSSVTMADLIQMGANVATVVWNLARPHGLVALVVAHTTSQQNLADTSRAGDPQDSTPGVWDVLFYGQTQGTARTPKRVFKFSSDIALSQHPKTKPEWQEFAGNGDQKHWNEDYAREYIRLSLLGVLPPAVRKTSYRAPDQDMADKWLSTLARSSTAKKVADILERGEAIMASAINLTRDLST
ncbi:heme peroxidase [Pseudomassariella vexata]|uniref:Peroxidase n=1 Tax=Pseudomassariella vexata TaxID=1141098 RepID=A0A1Y2E6Z3_9PEZI|nr:heme peroxidase [Pseudomassariella vexata]ORY67207.1 heme peroxidase [Pseudomassariella vexata]